MPDLNLPDGWVNCTIADIAEINPKKIDARPDALSGFVPMSLAPITFHGCLEWEEKPWGDIQKSYTNFKNGDVIFAKVTPCFENGKAAIVTGLPNGIGAGSSEFYVLRAHEPYISEKLIYAIIKTNDFAQGGAQNMTGAVGLRRVPRSFVETFPVALPPLAEQKVIAEKLDTLLAQVETTKARLERIPEILKRFRQSVLAAAVSGRLTEEWRGKKPEWEQTSLDECTDRIGDGLHGTPIYSEDGEYYFVNGNNLVGGSIVIKESTKRIDASEFLKQDETLGAIHYFYQ